MLGRQEKHRTVRAGAGSRGQPVSTSGASRGQPFSTSGAPRGQPFSTPLAPLDASQPFATPRAPLEAEAIPDDAPQKNLVWVAFGRGLLHSGACKRVCACVRLHRLAQMLTGDARAAGKAQDRTSGCRLSGPAIMAPVNFITKVRAAIPALDHGGEAGVTQESVPSTLLRCCANSVGLRERNLEDAFPAVSSFGTHRTPTPSSLAMLRWTINSREPFNLRS